MSSIEEKTKNVQEANDKIKKLEDKIKNLEDKIETLEKDEVTKTKDFEFWKTEKSQLQTDKNQLQAEKLLLLKELFKERERLPEIADGLNQTLDPNNNFHYKGKENAELVMKKFDKLKIYLARHYNCPITILNRNLLCTFAHTVHSQWKVGDLIADVELFNKSSISCHIVKIDKQKDCIWLRPTRDLPEQIKQLDMILPYLGQEIVSIGLSGNSETIASNQDNHNFKNVSFDISNVCCFSVDKNCHSKTNMKSRPGDSGGPIFDYYSGLFVGMMVGSEHDETFPGKFGGKGCFLPSVILHHCS